MSPLILSAVAGESPIPLDMMPLRPPKGLLRRRSVYSTSPTQTLPPLPLGPLGSYLVFLNLRPQNVELLQAQLTAPVRLPSVKESSRIWVPTGSVPWCVLSTGSL